MIFSIIRSFFIILAINIKIIYLKYKNKKISIDILEKEMNYLGNSKSRIKEIINQIVENKCN